MPESISHRDHCVRPQPKVDIIPTWELQSTLLVSATMQTQRLVFLFFFKSTILPRARAMLEISGEDGPCPDCNCSTNRTLFNITWSCVSTIIICAWVSVHPNVPPSGHWRALWQRLKTMFWTIVAPELILAWAVRQWFAAWEIRDTVNGDANKGSCYRL